MQPLKRSDLLSLEQYSEQREEFRRNVLEHKKLRRVHIGLNASLYFEDSLTIQYQVQEMLRIEKIFEASGIEEELAVYNTLVPDGRNWKATFMVEFPEVKERRVALSRLVGIENCVWMCTNGEPKVWAVADEDLERTTEEKTSAVHFLRFELPASFVVSVKSGSEISVGIDHEHYRFSVDCLPTGTRNSLVQDLD